MEDIDASRQGVRYGGIEISTRGRVGHTRTEPSISLVSISRCGIVKMRNQASRVKGDDSGESTDSR